MTAFPALLLAILLAFLHGTACDPTIQSISPLYGSLAGGTRLAIYGSGFPEMYDAMPVVYVGPYPCSVIMHLSSTEVLTCETSAGVAGTYFVAVAVTDQAPASFYGFTYSNSYTPSFKTVYPYAGPPGTAMTIYGDATWNLQYSDCAAKAWGDIDCVGAITFGDYLCRQDPSVYGTNVNFTYATQRYGTYLYILGCKLPTPDANNVQPAIGTANNLNVSIHFEASMRGGKPNPLRFSYHYTKDGTPYQFQLFSEVTAISPSVGSIAGGTFLNITGRGFPDLTLGLGDTVDVSVAGVPCTIVNSTYDTVFCITGPKPASLPTPINGLYPGMRGVEYEFYNTSSNTPGFSSLWTLNKTLLLSNTNGTGSYKTVLTGAMESIHYETSWHCALLKAFFVAPRTGTYSFYLEADDYAQLNGTYRRSDGVIHTDTLVTLQSWTNLDQYLVDPRQKSAPLPLTAGQTVLLESAHCNTWSIGMQQVAVRMEVPQPQANSIAEQQVITASAVRVARSIAIKYLYGAGADTTVYTINVTSADDSKLNSTSLALELTINTAAGEKVVVLPLLATGREMTYLIEAAFAGNGSLGSNGTSFGVYKARIPGLMTVQVGLDAKLATALGFVVELARLVVVPAPPPFLAATCAGGSEAAYSPPPPSAADVANATAGMVVILEQSRPVAAVYPGGYFQLRTPTSSSVVVLPYDANATVMNSAIRSLTSQDNSMLVLPVRREGPFLARVWNATFDYTSFNNVPEIVAETNDRSVDGVDMDLEVRRSNPPVTGTFRVGFGSSCDSVEIGVTDVAETIRLKLASLPGMTAPQSVTITGGAAYGYTYTVTFDPIGNPGDQPQLRVTDISGLRGIGVNASSDTVMNGSTDAFYAPIPTEFLRLAVAQPGTIDLLANGVPSACADPTGICGFQYSEAVTPHMTSVSPSVLQFASQATFQLTITGSGFTDGPGGVEVRVGTALCNVTSLTATQITCDVPETAPAGIRLTTVNVAGLGFALGASNITLETLYVTGSTPSPVSVASVGLSVFNFTGKGFDYVDCANNEMLIDGSACGILACGPNFLTALYRGNGGTDVAAASVTAQVYENGTMIDSDTPAFKVGISGSAPTITINSPHHMPGCGGSITVALAGATAADVKSVYMVPAISSLLNYTEASDAYRSRLPCASVTSVASAAVNCTSPALRNGAYHTLVVLSSGLQLLSSDTILFETTITSVYPNMGSIGGNTTVTITGSGFSPNVAANAVFMTVPVSTTFLNGIIECVTVAVTATTLTCRTGNSMAANADADDPKALKVMPVASPARPVAVVLCDPGYNTTILRGYCWALDETPRANCLAADPADCNFGYATDLTPEVGGMNPTRGYGGQILAIGGTYMQDITTVKFYQKGVVMGYGTGVTASAGIVHCYVPDLRPGVYTLVLMKGNGELSVDPYGFGVFTVHATITAVENNVGSLAGGLPLGLTIGGAGLAVSNADNVVSIAGVACPLISVENRTHLTCRAPGINGYVFAEYWNIGWGTYSMPDIITFTDPLVTRLEKGMAFAWNGSSPLPGTIQLDYFAARFTFYYQIATQENVTFVIYADDNARLYIDDEYVGPNWTYLNTILAPGVHKIVVTFVEYSGWASLKLQVALTPPNGTQGSFANLEWRKVTPVAPGTPLPISLAVSGVKSDTPCAATTKVLQLPSQPPLSFEPSELTTASGECDYVYTTHRTPSLTNLSPLTASGIISPNFNNPTPVMNVFGSFLTDPDLPAADQIIITIANQSCVITNVTPTTYNGINTTNITCTAPFAPVGTWAVNIVVAGLGLTRPTPTAATDLPLVTYGIKVTAYNSPNYNFAASKCYFSLFGGGTFNISGYGFVRGLVDTTYGLNMTAAWEPSSNLCGYGTTNSPPCQAANSSRMNLVPLGCDGPTAAFQLTRFKVPNPEAYANNGSINSITVRYRPRVYNISSNNTVYSQPGTTELLYFCGARTPALSGVSPASAPSADAGAMLSLTWALGVGSQNNTINPTPPGSLSNATVEFEVGPTLLRCASVTVTSASIGASSYSETITCKMPAYMPAATYTLWLCIQPFGCGLVPSYQVPLTVYTPSATTGSSAGGISVVIVGKGFDTNATLVSARFGNSTCKITDSSATSVTCQTGPLDAKPSAAVTWPLSITPTVGAAEVTYPGFTFTFDPALESNIYNISPTRGSTEGGTPVTIIGDGFQIGATTTVTIGDIPCGSVNVINSTAVTCTTGKPPKGSVRVPLAVSVLQGGRGFSRGTVKYQYFDVWSRNSTWGGGPLPGYEDTVVIPAGYTILLDISPPKLYIIVIEGELIFDDTKPYINLQAHYIINHGGNFTIGTPEKPYPGRANITMHGAPNSKDLPQYGAKSLAVRTGIVTFFGRPKIPHYAKLNQSADINDTRIVVGGAVNWEVGDHIVIAASGFLPWENDEAIITALDNSSMPGCTVIYLDVPLKYTHLGEIHSEVGVAQPLDMRAEVAVLTRNIVLMGDWTSAKNQYGVQIMVNTPSYLPKGLVRFDNIEITQSGQAFRLGRYSMHWHLMGDVNWQTWVRGCAIHHTYNRAITVHGTHRAIIQNVTAYHTMGHTFFLEDGIESMNLIENTISIYAKVSDALLNTDTTPGAFWMTNPNNTLRNCVAVGSMAHGYWYRLLDNPDGPSATTTVCPKFTPLLEFTNNTAHSNMFYGLRIHPEFYPRNNPCLGFYGTFQRVPAVYNGMVAYKNGMKGAVASQMALVQFTNMVMGDNGGGPKALSVSGKDHGGNMEMTWVTDDRDRYDVSLTEMAGFVNATIYARTTTGARGSAGQWYSDRRVTGTISQSAVTGDPMHSALMSMINMTFVDFTADKSGFSAIEACGKCKGFQGGATTFTANISFVNNDGTKPVLSVWSWGHQGIFLDTDGTLLNKQNLPEAYWPDSAANWTFGPGATWHSAVENDLFDPTECVYLRNATVSNNGAYCAPELVFRRVMLNKHGPESLKYKDLDVVALATNRTSVVHFSGYNEDGYQFTTAVNRDYWLTWDMVWYRLDPEYYRLHKMDLMNGTDFVYYSSKYIQPKDHFTVNNLFSNRTDLPPALPNTTHGDFYYNKTWDKNSWTWSLNHTYNDTKFTVYVGGRTDYNLWVNSYTCPDEGCNNLPDLVVDVRNGTLYWSNASTWNVSIMNFHKPEAGDNVTIPQGWDLVIDESPPPLLALTVQGNLRFDPTRDVNLTATYILVMAQGVFSAGSPSAPHPSKATIYLVGDRDTPDYGIDNDLNLGSKVLAALAGGTINFYGRRVNKRWIRLGSKAQVGDSSIHVSDPSHGWQVGDRIVITSTSYNWQQSEIRTITGLLNGGADLVLDSALTSPHGATYKSYPGGPTVDLRAEVGLASSNILITSLDGSYQHALGQGGTLYGAHVTVSGASTGRFDSILMEYCGQAGLSNHSCVFFDRLQPILVPYYDNSTNKTVPATVDNPSFLNHSSLMWGLSSNLRIGGDPNATAPTRVENNVMYESFEAHSVIVLTNGNVIRGNLVLGTIKDMAGQSVFDTAMPSSFVIASAANWVTDNVAAGGERYGFTYYGVPCSTNFSTGVFRNNSAHSYLAGMWLQSSNESYADGCTALRNFTVYMNWDFGIISTQGIATDIVLENVNVLDNKHAGVTLLRMGELTEEAGMWWYGGLLAGQSSDDVCTACATTSDLGCHKKLSLQSYNQYDPFSPAMGLQASQFALKYYPGPEPKPWDKPKSYTMVHGMFNISGITIADFKGTLGCGGSQGAGTYALANHWRAPETFYPHYFADINVVDVTNGPSQGMFYNIDSSQSWRGELCGEANYTREDGSVIMLSCTGPKHVHWRDLDGSLTGTVGVTSGIFKEGPRVFPMDQGSPVLPGPCTYSSVFGGYSCAAGSTEFLLDPRLKPKPIPAVGIWGNPEYFVLESRDKDSEDRNFGPVFFNVSGSIDLVTVQMDHGCCFTYKCQKRLSTFATYLPTGQTHYINFTGTPAQIFRMWLPYADPDKEIVLVINYLYTLNRRFVMMPPGQLPGVMGRIVPESQPPVIGDGTGHGAYYWDQNNTLMYVKLTGGKHLEVRTESAVQITQKFALTVDQFWDIQELFLKSLAYAMNITLDRIFIVNVKAGSALVTTAIASVPTDVDELTIADGRDASDPVPTTPPPVIDPPADLTVDDKAHLAAMGDAAPKAPTMTEIIVLRQLWALFDKYLTVIDTAAGNVGFKTDGVPTATFPALSATDEAAAFVKAAEEAAAAAASPSPPPAQGTIIPVGNSGTDNSGGVSGVSTTGGGGGGSVSSSGGSGSGGGGATSDKKSFPIGAAIGGAVGGCLIAGVVMLAIFAIQRRKAKKLRPVTPPDERNQLEVDAAAVPEAPERDGSGSQGGVREAFTVSSPTGAPASRPPSIGVALDAERAVLVSPRSMVSASGSLAAGYAAPSEPETIRPLVSTSKQPHSALPLVPAAFPLGAPLGIATATVVEGQPSRRQSMGTAPKAPAQLQRGDSSLNRNSAPQWDGDVSALPPAAQRGRMSRSVTDARPTSASVGGSRPSSATVEPPPRRVSVAAAPAADESLTEVAAVAAEAAVPGGEDMVMPVQRTLETMESFVPRPKSRAAAGSRPGSGKSAYAAGAEETGEGALRGGVAGATELLPPLPGSPQEVRRRSSSSPPQPTMQLPGGMFGFEASASLIRSEAAAQVIAAAASSQAGFGGDADAVMQEEREQGGEAGGSSPQAARTPAGLRSDSMRWRSDAKE